MNTQSGVLVFFLIIIFSYQLHRLTDGIKTSSETDFFFFLIADPMIFGDRLWRPPKPKRLWNTVARRKAVLPYQFTGEKMKHEAESRGS